MESLNNDILLLIFEYLDEFSIRNCAKVSRRWNSLIYFTRNLTKYPTLSIDISAWEDDKNESRELMDRLTQKLEDFPFKSFKLTSNSHLNCKERSIMRIFKKNCQNIEKLYIKSFSGGLMLSMLNFAAPTLTHLIVSSTFPDDEYFGTVNLPNLQFLKVDSVDSILAVIKCVNLRSLYIDNCRDDEAVTTFMKNSNFLPKLKTLKTFHLFWLFNDIHELPFELESLIAMQFSDISTEVFHKFLLSQANSLKILSIMEKKIRTSTVGFVLDNLTNLKTFKIFGSILGTSEVEIESCQKNFTIKILEMFLISPYYKLYNTIEYNEARDIEKILKKCVNLTTFNLHGTVSTTNVFEGNISLPQLRNLKIENLQQMDFWNCFEVRNLRKFTIENLTYRSGNLNGLLGFLSKIPRLRNFEIEDIEHYLNIMKISDLEKLIDGLKTLKSLNINRCEGIPMKFLNILKNVKSKTFKFFQIACLADEKSLNLAKNFLKFTKFQTIFKKFQIYRSEGVWEKDIEHFKNDEDFDEDDRIERIYECFMTSSLYPDL